MNDKKNSLKKHERISSKKEISWFFETGERFSSGMVGFVFLPNSLDFSRSAVIVSKKHGNAVKRNAIKRTIREVVRTHKFTTSPYYDFLVRPRIEIRCNQTDIAKDFETWKRFLEKRG